MIDIIETIELEGKLPTQKIIDEKFTDIINYMYLLEALIKERRDNGI